MPRQEALEVKVPDVGEVLAEGRLGLVVDAVEPAAGAEASRLSCQNFSKLARCPRARSRQNHLPVEPRARTVSIDLKPFQTDFNGCKPFQTIAIDSKFNPFETV